MKQLCVLMLLVTLLLGCSLQAREQPSLLTPEAGDAAGEATNGGESAGEAVDAIEREMAGLAEGRWTEYSAFWSPEDGMFFLSATADPNSDAAAIKAYCRILDDIASKHLPGVKVSAAVFFQSGAKIECK